jgi:hypothetical protein
MMPTSAVWSITSKALSIPLSPLYKNSNGISIYARFLHFDRTVVTINTEDTKEIASPLVLQFGKLAITLYD